MWLIREEDVEIVDQARFNQASSPIDFSLELSGIAKISDDDNRLFNVIPIRSREKQLRIELSHWDRIIDSLGYSVFASQQSLVSLSTLEHSAWADATERVENARMHLRYGEDDDALRECLSALEGVVSAPYKPASWESCVPALQSQKVEGIVELFSGSATYCNKVGHHRDRGHRDDTGELLAMPLDHWEADLAIAIALYLLTYIHRLQSNGSLTTTPPETAHDDESREITQANKDQDLEEGSYGGVSA